MKDMQIDRLVADRKRKRKKRLKYFWSIVAFLLLYFIALGIFILIVRSPAFQAKTITIEGNDTVTNEQIIDLLEGSIIHRGDLLNAPNSGLKALLGFHSLLIWPSALPSSTIAAIPELAGITISKNYFLHTIAVTVTERQPFAVWCLMPDDNCFWFDLQGTAFEKTIDTEGNAILVIHDYAPDQSVVINQPIMPAEFLPNLISIANVLKTSGVDVQSVALDDLSLQQIDVTTVNGPMLYFSLRFLADDDLAVLENLMTMPGFDNLQYVDFTVQNRAYYK